MKLAMAILTGTFWFRLRLSWRLLTRKSAVVLCPVITIDDDRAPGESPRQRRDEGEYDA